MQNLKHIPAQRTRNDARPMSPREWALAVISCGEDYRRLPFAAAEVQAIGEAHAALVATGVGRLDAETLLRHYDDGRHLRVVNGGGNTTQTPRPALTVVGAR